MDLGPRLVDTYDGLLRHVLALHPPGIALEFGVARGGTLALIAATMPAIGFDSFTGLPEDWRSGFDAGRFACDPPDIPGAQLVVGLFADTLSGWQPPGPIGLVHIDCDLYSSTATVLHHIGPHLEPGCLIVFDEFWNWPGWETDGECRAWAEYVAATGTAFDVLGHGPEQLAIRIK